ncbi:CG5084 [Drosophila busckii]|uniref:CG5084 n=1 Tax=Drosophila busckii TaxID=30019 RepID=A0A0M5J2Z0_DROBS|nr:uncharacterized protein LOC108595779 [Drosophila busckii]ALC42156.1 CG5084 [Drosophila busckii]
MQLFTRVLLLSALALGLSVASEVVDKQSLLRMVFSQMRFDERALSPAEQTCINLYNNATNHLGEQLANSTSNCEDAANRTTVNNYRASNSSVNDVRNKQLQLIKALQTCQNMTDNKMYLNCTTANFDSNLYLLDSANILAYETESQYAANMTVVDAVRSSCISSAVSHSKTQSIQAANDYDACIEKTKQQRDLLAAQPKPAEHEQKPEKPVKQEESKEPQPAKKPELEVAVPAKV